MKKVIILIMLCVISRLYSREPVQEPAYLGSLDTMSKTYRLEKLRYKAKQRNQNQIQGEIITDPRVVFSTYISGNGYDCGNSVAVDSKGNVYVVGYTGSTNFPISDNSIQKQKNGIHDMFIGKFTTTGERLWLTYYGGSGENIATDCAVDKDDNLLVVGKTTSKDFPIINGVEQDTALGGVDGVIIKFNGETGGVIWSRYYGGTKDDIIEGIAMSSNKEDFVITGGTLSGTVLVKDKLPVTKGVYQDTLCSYIRNVWGSDAFVSKFSGEGKLIWGTYFGGAQNEDAHSVAVDKEDNVAIVGETSFCFSSTKYTLQKFPVTSDAIQKDTLGGLDPFYAKFSSDGSKLLYSTLYCGKGKEWVDDVKFDNEGSVIFCGETESKDFPTTANAYKSIYLSPDGFIVKFNKNNQREWATLFGGDKGDPTYDYADEIYSLDIDTSNNIWLLGLTLCTDINTSADAILKNNLYGTPLVLIVKLNPTSFPEWISLYASNFAYKIVSQNTSIYFTGEMMAGPGFPINTSAFQKNTAGGSYDGFLVHIDLSKTDIKDTIKRKYTAVYPNPSEDKIIIPFDTVKPIINIILYDMLGRKITEEQYKNTDSIELNISNLAQSIYIIEIKTDNEIFEQQFIKK